MKLNGRLLKLAAGKLPRENTGMFAVKEIKLVYIVTEGNSLAKIDLQRELDRVYFFIDCSCKSWC